MYICLYVIIVVIVYSKILCVKFANKNICASFAENVNLMF